MTAQHHVQLCRDKAAPEGSSVYYSLLFTRAPQLTTLLGLAALSAELRDIPRQVSDPQLAHIKLAWWKTELDQAAAGQTSHPISLCIGQNLLAHTPADIREQLCQAAADGVSIPRFFTSKDWQNHCLNLGGGFFYMSALCLGISQVDQLEKIRLWGGCAQQLTQLLNLGKSLSQGWHPIPVDTLQQHQVSVQLLRTRQSSPAFERMMEHVGDELIKSGHTAWASLSKQSRRQLKPLRALWRMRLAEWRLAKGIQFRLLDQGVKLTPLKKFTVAWTSHALGL